MSPDLPSSALVSLFQLIAKTQTFCFSGDPVKRRTLVALEDPGLHRLLWQRSNQSDLWVMDDVIIIVKECPMDDESCRFGRAKEDFNGILKCVML